MKITQKMAVFYMLLKSYYEDPNKFMPAWKFVGELHIPELNKWFLMSYKCPTNGLEIYFDNPNLIERRWHTGKSGAKYYEYRIAPNPSIDKIIEPKLLKLYEIVKANK